MPHADGLLKELKSTTLGKLLTGPRDPKLEPVYSALAVIVSLYLVYKIPILFLISYSSMHRFYPYDLIEHWGNVIIHSPTRLPGWRGSWGAASLCERRR